MKTLKLFSLLALALFCLASTSTPAFASASAYEYYSTSSGPSVCAAQITGITHTWGGSYTLHFADGDIVRDWSWMNANSPVTGGYLVAACGSALSPLPFEDSSYSPEESFESGYSAETYAHGGHEPVVVILD